MSIQLVYETHATTVDNERGVATGWLPGKLSQAGVDNARDLGKRRTNDAVDVVISSDLARAVRTVDLAFEGSPIPRLTDVRLREINYGELNGAPVGVIDAQRRDRIDEPFPGGQSYREVTAAVRALLDELRAGRDGERVLLVGHAATRYALDHLLTGRPLEAAVRAPFAWRPGWEYDLGASTPDFTVLDREGARAVAGDIEEVYRAAFTAPGYDETEQQVRRFADDTFPAHAARHGFRLVTMRLDGELVGFGYAYTGQHGQWWTDQMASAVPSSVADEWLGGHLEVVELAVDPRFQRRGYGVALLDHLLADVSHDRALLTTYANDLPAPRLYARLGWQRLATGVFGGTHDLWGLRL